MQEKILEYVVGMLTFGISQRRLKDRKVFERLIEQLPPASPAILLLKEHDMGGPLQSEVMTPLYAAIKTWNDVDNQFQTKGIEKRKGVFIAKLEEFLRLFGQRAGPEGKGFVGIGIKDYEDRPEMFRDRDRLNELGTDAYHRYNEFYRYAHRKLPV